MSAIKTELAAFIAAHTSEDFVMTPITMREASLHTAWEQELPKVPMASVVDTVLDGCESTTCRSASIFPIRAGPCRS